MSGIITTKEIIKDRSFVKNILECNEEPIDNIIKATINIYGWIYEFYKWTGINGNTYIFRKLKKRTCGLVFENISQFDINYMLDIYLSEFLKL